MTEGQFSIEYGDQTIPFTLIRSNRRTLAIHVHPDLSVRVLAPQRAKQAHILQMVHKRAAWIVKKQHQFETYLPPVPPRGYINGETHRYLGRQYRLKIDTDYPAQVRLKGGRLWVSKGGNSSTITVQALVDDWFYNRAKLVLSERLEECLLAFEKYKINRPDLNIRSMKTRWGSCSPKGRITLNTKLAHVPKRYIDYVVIHELCHLKVPNHGEGFYNLLTSVMPDWRERREKLNWYGSR